MHNALQCFGELRSCGWSDAITVGTREGVLTSGGSCTPCVHTLRKCFYHVTTTAELVVSAMLHMYVVSGNSSSSFAS